MILDADDVVQELGLESEFESTDMSVAKYAALKPRSRHTRHKLRISLLAVIAGLPRPVGVVLDWLAQSHPVRPYAP
jgi:hypothetical protein